MKKGMVLCLWLFSIGWTNAQNLVPNPSFELMNSCPPFPLFSFCQSWTVPVNHFGSPDYFNACATSSAGVPDNYMGYQQPATGNAYGGILVKTSVTDTREYMQTQFTAPLVAGEVYHVALKCSWANSAQSPFQNITTNALGMYISQTPVSIPTVNTLPIPIVPQYNPILVIDTLLWTDMSFNYTATGGELYLLIGNFRNDASTTITPVSGATYIYIDDVSVTAYDEIFAIGDTMLCPGESTTLTAQNGTTYAWADATTPNTVFSTNGTITVTPPITTTYNLYGPLDTGSVTVHVNPIPTVDAGPDITVCPQEPVTLSGSGATFYLWNNNVSNGIAFLPNTATATYVLTGIDINSCQNTDTVTVNVTLDGCPNFPNTHGCDVDAIRQAFAAAGCVEMLSCVDACSMYFLNPQSMSGSQAQAFAQTLGANLVSIQSAQENTCLVGSLVNLGLNNINDVIWIGLNDEQTEGTFVWYDQSPVTYSNWSNIPNPQPDNWTGADPNGENCVQIYPDGGWNDLSCASSDARSVIEVNLCPVVNAGLDVNICAGVTAPLNAGNTLFGSSPYTYAWNNGVQTQSNPVSPTVQTQYTVTSEDRYSCQASDSVTVNLNPSPYVNLGNDTVACQTDNLLLVAYQSGSHIAGTQYVWQNGALGPFFTPTQSGTYWVTATLNGCSASDTVQLILNPTPAVNLGNNQVLCQGQSLLLDANTPNATYLWQDNSTAPTYTVTQGGTYSVTVNVGTCTATGTVTITEQPMPVVNLGNDVTLCTGQALVLDAGTPNATYVWQNNSTGASFSPTQSGTYWVRVTVNGCSDADSISVQFLPLPTVNLGNDSLPCIGTSMLLDATGTNLSYQWTDGSTAPTLTATQSGTYSVTVTDNNGCSNSDAVKLTFIPPPQFQFDDSTLCKGDLWTLDISTPAAVYLWQDKSVLPTFTVHGAGTYWGKASNACGSHSDTLEVLSQLCDCHLYIANCFTPNRDNINEKFLVVPVEGCTLDSYSFSLYNRWGQLIFETDNVEYLWDGTVNGKSAPLDMYVYRVAYKFHTGSLIQRLGHITLVR